MKKSEYVTPDILEQNRLLLYLKELELEENERFFENIMKHTLFQEGLVTGEIENATAEQLAKIDLSYLDAKKKNDVIRMIAPEIVDAVEQKIKDTEIIPDLKEAGYPITRLSGRFVSDLKVAKCFHNEFPDPSGPSFIDKLKSAKKLVVEAVKSDTGNVLLGAAMFSVTVATGGAAGIAVSGALYATKLMENKKVQGLMDSLQSKTDKFLINYGFKSEAVEGRNKKLSEKMQGLTDSKWFKVAKVTAMCCMVGAGTFALTTALTDSNLIQSGIESASSALGKAADMDIASSLSDGLTSAKEYADGMIESVRNSEITQAFNEAARAHHDILNGGNTALVGADYTVEFTGSPDVQTDSVGLQGDEAMPTPSVQTDSTGLQGDKAIPTPNVDSEAVKSQPTPDVDSEAVKSQPENTDASALLSNEQSIEHVVVDKQTSWSIAKEHFASITGSEPSYQQIISMINDFGLENPHEIMPGQVINLPVDMSPYLDEGSAKVYAATLPEMRMASIPSELIAKAPLDIQPTGISPDIQGYNQDHVGAGYLEGEASAPYEKTASASPLSHDTGVAQVANQDAVGRAVDGSHTFGKGTGVQDGFKEKAMARFASSLAKRNDGSELGL
jgi:hypothetical protein